MAHIQQITDRDILLQVILQLILTFLCMLTDIKLHGKAVNSSKQYSECKVTT